MDFLPIIIAITITGAGIVTGLLFAFSNFTLQSLADLPAEHGMFAMQRINKRIINPIFLLFFLGTPALCLLAGVLTVIEPVAPGRLLVLGGAVAYLVGPFGITVLFNVPLNNRLANENSKNAADYWPQYQEKWQFWNHIRTYLGVISIVCLALGQQTG